MTFRLRTRTWLVFVVGMALSFVVVIAAHSGLVSSRLAGSTSNLGDLVVVLGAAVITLLASRCVDAPLRLPWVLIGIGMACYVVGDALWAWFEFTRRRSVP